MISVFNSVYPKALPLFQQQLFDNHVTNYIIKFSELVFSLPWSSYSYSYDRFYWNDNIYIVNLKEHRFSVIEKISLVAFWVFFGLVYKNLWNTVLILSAIKIFHRLGIHTTYLPSISRISPSSEAVTKRNPSPAASSASDSPPHYPSRRASWAASSVGSLASSFLRTPSIRVGADSSDLKSSARSSAIDANRTSPVLSHSTSFVWTRTPCAAQSKPSSVHGASSGSRISLDHINAVSSPASVADSILSEQSRASGRSWENVVSLGDLSSWIAPGSTGQLAADQRSEQSWNSVNFKAENHRWWDGQGDDPNRDL